MCCIAVKTLMLEDVRSCLYAGFYEAQASSQSVSRIQIHSRTEQTFFYHELHVFFCWPLLTAKLEGFGASCCKPTRVDSLRRWLRIWWPQPLKNFFFLLLSWLPPSCWSLPWRLESALLWSNLSGQTYATCCFRGMLTNKSHLSRESLRIATERSVFRL